MASELFSFWHGGEFGVIQDVSIGSLGRLDLTVDVYSYQPLTSRHSNVVVRDAREVVPENRLFQNRSGGIESYAQFSDYFRLKKLYEHGGTWIDLDLVFLRDFTRLPYRNLLAWEDESKVNGAVLKLERQSPLARKGIDNFENPGLFLLGQLFKSGDWNRREVLNALASGVLNRERLLQRAPWGVFGGPHFLTDCSRNFEAMGIECLPSQAFYPVHWTEVHRFLDPAFDYEKLIGDESCYCIHLYNSLLKRELASNRNPNPNCLWTYFCRQFLD